MTLPRRPEDSNKATFGSVLNIAGSVNFRGAAYLSSASALRIGAGYVTLAAIPPVIDSVAKNLPDAIFLPLPQNGSTLSKEAVPLIERNLKGKSSCAFGCGISALGELSENMVSVVESVLGAILREKIPTVLDADGLNFLSQSKVPFLFEKRVVMTPHPKELARLLHTDVDAVQKDRIRAAREASQKYGAIVLLKGHRTVVSDGERYQINRTGNSALAKAGSGDCLTGIIAGLLAQGMEPFDAAVLGAKIHGLAGEMASRELSEYGVLASDLPRYVAKAIRQIDF